MIITGGRVFDPEQGLSGEVRNIHVAGARITKHEPASEMLNVPGCVVMAGGLDIHSHAVAVSRLAVASKAEELEAWGDFSKIEDAYLSLGYTFLLEAGLWESEAREFERRQNDRKIGFDHLQLGNPHGKSANTPCKFIGGSGMEEFLRLPLTETVHHLHLPHLAREDAFSVLEGFLCRLSGRRCHLSHLSHYAFESRGGKIISAGQRAARMIGPFENVTVDCGPVVFGPALTFTADVELAQRVARSAKKNLVTHTSSPFSATPYRFRKESYIDSLLWATAMEFMLSFEDLGRLSLSIDYPSGGELTGCPFIIGCLMDRDIRNRFLASLNPEAVDASRLQSIDRELTLSEIAVITRSSPAKVLGRADRGNLKEGAAADLVIYPESSDRESMFSHPRYVIKDGKILKEARP